MAGSTLARSTYTEADALRDAQTRANREQVDVCVYLGMSLSSDIWFVRVATAAPPRDHGAYLFRCVSPQTVCPNCDQWQHASSGDCLNECRRRGFA
jgi:hypothetical protein